MLWERMRIIKFPIAWGVVEGENQTSWTWFIQLLKGDLGIFDGLGWTIISDQQKVHNVSFIIV